MSLRPDAIEAEMPVAGVTGTFLARPQILDALDTAVQSGLAVVTAGPGWGKSTAVAAWADRRASCWVTVEAGDSARRLVGRILQSIRRQRPGVPPELLLASPPPGRDVPPPEPVELTVTALCRLLAAHLDDELVLVLDRVHVLPAAGAAARLVAGLARQRPAALRLVAITEPVPDGPATCGALAEAPRIDSALLAFSPTEVAAFLQARLGAAEPEVAARVSALTAGRPAAVRLATEAFGRSDPASRSALARLPGGDGVVAEMTERVVAGLPQPDRQLLTTAAVVGRCDALMCEALGHRHPGPALTTLAEKGLLRRERPDDLGHPIWSVIQPVRELLLGPRAADPASVRDIRVRAAAQHADRAEYGPALQQLLAAKDRPGTVRFLLAHGEALLSAGEADAVLLAADSLDLVGASPALLGLVGHARQLTGDWMGALALLKAAAASSHPLNPTLALRLGQLLYIGGRPAEALATYDRSDVHRDLAAGSATSEEIRLLCHAAVWMRAVGEDERARQTADRAVAAAELSGEPRDAARCHWTLALIAAHDGDRPLHDVHHRRALRLADRAGDRLLQLGLRINRASYLAEEGTPAEALEEAQGALLAGESLGAVGYEPFWYSIRARAKARLGQFADALADLDGSEQRWQDIGPSFDVPFGLIVRGDIHRRRGEPGQAHAALTEALRAADSADMRPLQTLALAPLARVQATEDQGTARELADRAVALASGTGVVPALLARGWVALIAGAADQARHDADRARSTAGARRDRAGLAEALELTVLAAPDPKASVGLLDEAGALWAEIDDPVGQARVELVRARLAGPAGVPAADAASARLGRLGVRVDAGVADAVAVRTWEHLVTVRTLGAFEVHRRGVRIPSAEWRSKKARDLFKILISHRGRAVPRERLIELLWPGDSPSRTANRLSVLLSTLRSGLDPERVFPEPGPLIADRETVALDLTGIAVDLEAFLDLAATARAADRTDEPTNLAQLRAADAAWTGEYLPDDLYEEWAEPQRDTVRTTHVAVLRALLRRSDDADERERCLYRLLDHDPYDEHAHRQLISALRAAGRHGEAERRYRAYAARMAEIGVTPADD